jgi:hypothetical protein
METEPRPLASDLIRAVEVLSEAFSDRSIRYALIGGLATMLRGRPRFTQDVDVLLDVPQITIPALLNDLSQRGFALDPATVAAEFVRDHLTMFRFGAVRIDWLKPVLPLYAAALAHASELPWTEGHRVRVAAPEGLILTKLVAFRDQDQADIVTLLAANRHTLDLAMIRREWRPYAESEPSRTAWLDAAIARVMPANDGADL